MKIGKIHFLIILLTLTLFSCSSKNILAERYPQRIKALLLGVERATLKGSFSKGGFSRIKELFTTTEFEIHKSRVIDKLNELKGAFAETTLISDIVYENYKKVEENNQFFNFYKIEGIDFRSVPYIVDIPSDGIDRSLSSIIDKLQSNIIVEIRPIELIYNESGSRMSFDIKINVIVFDTKVKKNVYNKIISLSNRIKEAFYTEEELKSGEKPTPGFEKIKVSFNIENYKREIKSLAEVAAPEIINILKRK